MALVSVIMAVHNSSRYLREAVESVRSQTHQDWELLVTDDASSDNSVEILESYGDSRIKVFPLANNAGPAAARNNSLRHARGEFIAILDSDDTAVPDRFERQLSLLSECPKLRASGSLVNCFLPQTLGGDHLGAALLFRNLLFHSSLIYRVPIELYNTHYRYSHDYELAVRLSKSGLSLTHEIYSTYRSHAENVSHRFSDKQRAYAQQVQAGQLAGLGLVPDVEQSRLHFHLGLGSSFNNLQDLERAGAWLRTLINSNRATAAYPDLPFIRTCEHIWHHACLNAAVPTLSASLLYARALPGVRQLVRLPAILWSRAVNRPTRT